ncbi:MAG: ATP-binding protein [Acidobacteriota bacterium]
MSESRQPPKQVPRILLLDDSEHDLALTLLVLRQAFPDAAVTTASNALTFGQAFERGGYDVVITEQTLGWTDGIKVLEAAKAKWPFVPVVMLADPDEESIAVEAMKAGLDDYLVKSSQAFVAMPEVVQSALDRAEGKRSEARLETRLQTLLDQSNVGVFRTTLDGRLLEVNPAFLRILGHGSLADINSIDVSSLLSLEKEIDPLTHFDESGRYRREIEMKRPDGTTLHLSVAEMILLDGEGDLVIDGLIEEVERVRPQPEATAPATESAPRADDEDLKRFAAMASHEIREPLRMTLEYTELLHKEHGQSLDAQAQRYLEYARIGAHRLEKLVEDLLQLSSLEKDSEPVEPVACEEIVEEARSQLASILDAHDAQITVDPLPTVHGDMAQLVLLFRNLLENAVKYRGKEPPRIRITARQQTDEWVFAVRDNGIGIEHPEDSIFEVFKRQHPEIPGNGVGLALCKGIVEHHGGKIWVDSRVGQGSTFWFTIPLTPAHRAEPSFGAK